MFNKKILTNLTRYKLTTLTIIGMSTTASIVFNNQTLCISDNEMKFVNATNLDKKLTNVATTFQRYMKQPENNKDLILHYTTNNNISIYYPYYKTFQETNNMQLKQSENNGAGSGAGTMNEVYDKSIGTYPYARIATLTIHAPMDDIISLVMSNEVDSWNKKSIIDYELLSTLPPSLRLAGTGDIEHNIYQPQVTNISTIPLSNTKSKPSPTSASTSSGPINPKNLVLSYKQQHLTNSIFNLNTREFYNWIYQAPAGIIGIFDKYTSICICSLDASHDYSKKISTDSSKPIGDDSILQHGSNDSSISSKSPRQNIRGNSNSIMLLENITPDKVKVTYGIEVDPCVYYLYNDNQTNTISNNLSTSLLLNDQMVFIQYLSDLKKMSEENYNNENMNHSIDEAARIKFNKQKQHSEAFHLNLKDNNINSVEDEELQTIAIEEQKELIKILTKSYNRISKDLQETPNDEDLLVFHDRILNDLNNAKNKYQNLCSNSNMK